MNDKKQRYNTIQKPYNNKYHHTTITTRNHALLLQYGRAAQYITIRTTTKGNSTNKLAIFKVTDFSYLI